MGLLLVAATPIGNLKDVSERLKEAIRDASSVACEDTRVFRKLCNALAIQSPRLLSYYEHNERESSGGILKLLDVGETVLLVSNAGTPLISDPGYQVVRQALEAGHRVSPIPGASAVITALSCSGLRSDKFAFLGFPPRKPSKLRAFLSGFNQFPGTIILYESPYRVHKLVAAAQEVFGPVDAVLAREMTKLHEEFIRASLDRMTHILSTRKLKGECCLLIENRP